MANFLCRHSRRFMVPTVTKEGKKRLILPSYDVSTGLYFKAESQDVSIDNITPEGVEGVEE